VYPFLNKTSFYSEAFLEPRPTTNLGNHYLSAVLECLFNIFVATLHIGDLSSIRNLGLLHAVVTETQLFWAPYN